MTHQQQDSSGSRSGQVAHVTYLYTKASLPFDAEIM